MILSDVNGKSINLSNSDKKIFDKYIRNNGRVKSGLQLFYKKQKNLYYFYYWNNQSGVKDEFEIITKDEAEEFLNNKTLRLNDARKRVLLID